MAGYDAAYIHLAPSTAGTPRLLHAGDITLELDGYRVRLPDGRRVPLRPKEHHLLRVLMENPGRALAHRELLDQVWGPHHTGHSNTLAVHIRRLRHVLDPGHGRIYGRIRTIPRLGYTFTPEGEGAAACNARPPGACDEEG